MSEYSQSDWLIGDAVHRPTPEEIEAEAQAASAQISLVSASSNTGSLVTRLLKAVPHGWRRLSLAILLSVCATGMSVALMGVSAWLLSRAAEHPPMLYLQMAVVGVRAFGIGRGVFRYAERLVGHDLALRMQTALRLSTYSKLSRTTLLGGRQGDLLMRVTADVEAIMDVVVRVVLPFSSACVVLLGTSTILAFFDLGAALVLLGCSILAGIVLPWIAQRWSARADAAAVPARAALANQVHQMSRSAVDLVAYDAQDVELAELSRIDAELKAAEMKAAWTRGVATGVQLLVMGIAVAAALILGSQAVAAGDMLGRNLAVLCLTPLALHESFQDLSKAAQTLTHAKASLIRVIELLKADPVGVGDRATAAGDAGAEGAAADATSDSETSSSAPTTAVLQLHELTIGWERDKPVQSQVSLTVAPRQSVAITGASGVGKTTLAATILGLIPPLAGELDAPTHIGYLAQDAHIFSTSVAENVRIGNPKATDEQVAQALQRAGIGHLAPGRLVGESGGALSGGEARRLALSRLLVAPHLPELVILDEPTEHLDQETAAALLDDLWAALGDSALLAITHDPNVIARCGTRLELE